MTQERFFQMVDDPDLLRRITYEELKTLALAYPYAHNLRCLLALKARQIDHPDAVRNLATAAAYSLDRTKLFLLVAPQVIVPQQVLAPEEVLELKPIETVKRELEALAPLAREERTLEPSISAEASAIPEPTAQPISAPSFVAETEPAIQEPAQVVNEPEPIDLTPPPEAIEAPPDPPAPPIRQAFSEWISHFQPPVLVSGLGTAVASSVVPKPAEKIEESPKTPGIAQQLAERSVAENQDVISETLAKLYAKQGYRDKSAQMYARLALLFPEKSAYFAAEIDKLKK